MIITAIEAITKTKAAVYLNDERAFVLTLSEIRQLDLSVNMTVTNQIQEDIDTVLTKKAKLKVMNLLQTKDYTVYEIRSRLKRESFPEYIIQRAIDYVAEYGYVDDRRYTETYLRYHGQGKSSRILTMKLRQKGIDSNIIEECMSEITIDEEEQIKHLIETKYKTDWIHDNAKKQKMIGFLMRRGYSYQNIRSVMKEFDIDTFNSI